MILKTSIINHKESTDDQKATQSNLNSSLSKQAVLVFLHLTKVWLFPLKISSFSVQTEQKKQDLTLHNYSPVCNNKDIVERMKSAQQRQQTYHKCYDLHLTAITLTLSEL